MNYENWTNGKLTIEDFSGYFQIMLFSKQYVEFKNFMEKGFKLHISGKVEPRYNDPTQFNFSINQIKLLDEMDVGALAIKLKINDVSNDLITEMNSVFEENKGGSNLKFLVYDPESKIWVQMTSKSLKIDINEKVLSYLENEKMTYKLF